MYPLEDAFKLPLKDKKVESVDVPLDAVNTFARSYKHYDVYNMYKRDNIKQCSDLSMYQKHDLSQ
jgi:hypothetical protein